VKTATGMKITTSADQRASVGKRPSWRVEGKMSIVARAAEGAVPRLRRSILVVN
jgi:hypothetical protein